MGLRGLRQLQRRLIEDRLGVLVPGEEGGQITGHVGGFARGALAADLDFREQVLQRAGTRFQLGQGLGQQLHVAEMLRLRSDLQCDAPGRQDLLHRVGCALALAVHPVQELLGQRALPDRFLCLRGFVGHVLGPGFRQAQGIRSQQGGSLRGQHHDRRQGAGQGQGSDRCAAQTGDGQRGHGHHPGGRHDGILPEHLAQGLGPQGLRELR